MKTILDLVEQNALSSWDFVPPMVYENHQHLKRLLEALQRKEYLMEDRPRWLAQVSAARSNDQMLEYVKAYPRVYAWLDSQHKNEAPFVLAACTHASMLDVFFIYKKMPIGLRNQDRYVKLLLAKNGNLFASLPKALRSREDLALCAMDNMWGAFAYVPKVVREENENLSHEALKRSVQNLRWCHRKVKEDASLVEALMQTDPKIYRHAAFSVRSQRALGLKAVQLHAGNYLHLSRRLQQDAIICEAALATAGGLLRTMPSKVQSDLRLVHLAMKSQGWAFNSASLLIKEKVKNLEVQMGLERDAALLHLLGEQTARDEAKGLEKIVKIAKVQSTRRLGL